MTCLALLMWPTAPKGLEGLNQSHRPAGWGHLNVQSPGHRPGCFFLTAQVRSRTGLMKFYFFKPFDSEVGRHVHITLILSIWRGSLESSLAPHGVVLDLDNTDGVIDPRLDHLSNWLYGVLWGDILQNVIIKMIITIIVIASYNYCLLISCVWWI